VYVLHTVYDTHNMRYKPYREGGFRAPPRAPQTTTRAIRAPAEPPNASALSRAALARARDARGDRGAARDAARDERAKPT